MQQTQDTPKQFIALYMEPLVKLMDTRDRAAHATLNVLAMCADPYGWCYPGDQYIGKITGHSPQTVAGALERLEMMQFIRIVYTFNPRRKRNDRDIQISPFVIALPEPYSAVAIERWNQPNVMSNQINHIDLTTDPTTRTNSSDLPPMNQLQNQQQQLQTPSDEAAATDPVAPESAQEGEPRNAAPQTEQDSAAGKQTAHSASQRRMAQTPTTPPTPSPPPPASLRRGEMQPCPEPLPDPLYEHIAGNLNNASGHSLSLAVSRGLVTHYGAERCTAAIKQMSRNKGIKNPGGYLRWLIESNQIDPQADGRDKSDEIETRDDGTQFISGKYAQFIEH